MMCNGTVLTADAYAAMTNGTCTPACNLNLPCAQVRSCTMLLISLTTASLDFSMPTWSTSSELTGHKMQQPVLAAVVTMQLLPVQASAFVPAPGPVQAPLCPGGRLPTAWNCTHLGQPYEFDLDSYSEAAPLANREQ